MVVQDTDKKNGIILSAGWAVLVAYILYVFSWTDMRCDGGDHGLIWSREQANIKLGVNDSINPCTDIYLNSCERYLQDSVGPFYHAALRSSWYIEQSEIYEACSKLDNKTLIFDSGSPRVDWSLSPDDLNGSGEDLWRYTFKDAFMQDCMVNGITAEVAPLNGVWMLIIDTEKGSETFVQHPNCLVPDFFQILEFDFENVMFGDRVCSDINFTRPVECGMVTSCKDYVQAFFPESLAGYGNISKEIQEKLTTVIRETYNTSIPIHYGGGKFPVPDAPASMVGATVADLRRDRKERQLELLGKPYTTSWLMPGTEVNAYYLQTTDEVFIGGGLLVEPFYHADYPFEHNLAGLGFVIAHEIGHSFGPKAARRWNRPDTTSVMEELEANLTTMSNHSGQGYGSELYADYRGAQAINDLVKHPTKLFFHHMAQTWCQRHQPWLDDPTHPASGGSPWH